MNRNKRLEDFWGDLINQETNEVSLESLSFDNEGVVDTTTNIVASALEHEVLECFDSNVTNEDKAALEAYAQNASIVSSMKESAKDYYSSKHDMDDYALENFDNQYLRSNKKASVYFNVVSGASDVITRATRAMFKPVPVGTESALELNFDRPYLTKRTYHKDGTPSIDYVNRSVVDILDNGLDPQTLRLLPVRGGAGHDEYLVDPAVITPRSFERPGEDTPIELSPILFGESVDLIGLDQSPNQLLQGSDYTSTIDRNPRLSAVYIKAGDDKLRLLTVGNNNALFTANKNGTLNQVNLNYTGTGSNIVLNDKSKDVDNQALVTLAALVTDGITLNVELSVSGTINTETGIAEVFYNGAKVVAAYDSFSEPLPLDDTSVADMVAAIKGAEAIGYTLDVRLTNANLIREVTVLDLDKSVRTLPVHVQSGIGVRYPVNRQISPSTLNALVGLCNDAKHWNAIQTIKQTAETLEAYSTDTNYGNVGALYGFGTELETIPSYLPLDLDLSGDLNSLTASERDRDISSLIYSTIRTAAAKLYVDSRLNTIHATMADGARPVFNVLCDDRIAMILRKYNPGTTVDLFDIEIVSSPSMSAVDKIYGIFQFQTTRNEIHPLDFGVLTEGVDLVYQANDSHANNGVSSILQVHPVYEMHVINPILLDITVTGHMESVRRIAVKTV